MENNSDRFIGKYHSAVVKALGKETERVKAKIANVWVRDFLRSYPQEGKGFDGFLKDFKEFLERDLGFADEVKITAENEEIIVSVNGCRICAGNEILRSENANTMCPIIHTGLSAIFKATGKSPTFVGAEKETGKVGYCTLRYVV